KPKPAQPRRAPAGGATAEPVFARLEFYRHAVALMPAADDFAAGVAIMVLPGTPTLAYRGCSCSTYKGKTCRHIITLGQALVDYRKQFHADQPDDVFRLSLMYRLARLIADSDTTPVGAVQPAETPDDGSPLLFTDGRQRPVVRYVSTGTDRTRFVDRLTEMNGRPGPSRYRVQDQLRRITLTESERKLSSVGMKTRRQAFEDSVWFRIAYHAFSEIGSAPGATGHDIDEETGQFWLTVHTGREDPLLQIAVPGDAVDRLLKDEDVRAYTRQRYVLSPDPVVPVLEITRWKTGAFRLFPLYRYRGEDGRMCHLTWEQFETFKLGNLVHLPGTKSIAPIHPPDAFFKAYGRLGGTVIKKGDVPAFLQKNEAILRHGHHIVDEAIKDLRIFSAPERITFLPRAMDRDWLWLSVSYGFGSADVSLAEILQSRQKGPSLIGVADGWVDMQSDSMKELYQLAGLEKAGEAEEGLFRVRRMDLFRLQSIAGKEASVAGDPETAAVLRRLLALQPSAPLPDLGQMRSPLRPYQAAGVQWLWFLYENGFGGLLCDDMGLGKTHQIMALMLCLHHRGHQPFLVVCPATVISHWEKKLRQHIPTVPAVTYHGQDRCFEEAERGHAVIVTSYGIVLRDAEALSQRRFALIVFDEIQQIKNAGTLTYQAARSLQADMTVGLTGTPIENTVSELKALMDMVVPGYLGTGADFARRYGEVDAESRSPSRSRLLRRLISTFTLRRMKQTVLSELPQKIEDIRFCRLSPDQVRLYREAVETRRSRIMPDLQDPASKIPYMHIFALLTLLKQICNHPALVEKKPEQYERWESGKWDLFTELLTEALDSGQKVVVYSQYVEMIRIIEQHLSGRKIGHAILTGKSRNRGALISRFNEDPGCRVFVGSLKAGGVGIDLVAASVVIHYDRWWNAAREDQATDRVHRIGQRRGVQVFKLVTEGTLEEKISAIIERKRSLLEHVVREDDPGLLKVFNREQLIELMEMP
ncbi:MAG: DEAD/DEAH box helicase, partial [Desulfofustis sp.]|nr:DEAD/DEAH box helicase [Desulfofustis sp.]